MHLDRAGVRKERSRYRSRWDLGLRVFRKKEFRARKGAGIQGSRAAASSLGDRKGDRMVLREQGKEPPSSNHQEASLLAMHWTGYGGELIQVCAMCIHMHTHMHICTLLPNEQS